MTTRTDALRPDNRPDKELAIEILSTPLYPAGDKEPEESFEQVLKGTGPDNDYAKLFVATRAIVNRSGNRSAGQQTKLVLSGTLQITNRLRENYAEFITHNQRELDGLSDDHEEAAFLKMDSDRSKQAIENLSSIDELYRKLARKIGIEMPAAAQQR